MRGVFPIPIFLVTLMFACMPADAQAVRRRSKQAEEPPPVPDLEEVLRTAGWSITPEMSAAYSQPGDIFDGGNSLIKKGEDCFAAKVHEGAYASMEVNRSLESGVRMKVMVGSGRVGVGLTKKLVFDTPTHRQIARLDLVPTPACHGAIEAARARGMPVDTWFVVTEALSAVVQKQECGQFSVEGGSFVVSADVAVQQACAQTSLEPVAVAYKTVPLVSIMGSSPPEPAVPVAPKAIPVEVKPVTTAQPPMEEDPMLAELRALKSKEDDRAAQQTETAKNVRQAKAAMLARAAQAWELIEQLIGANPDVALPKVQQFVDRYEKAKVTVEGPDGPEEHAVLVPQVGAAKNALDELRSPKVSAADPVLMAHDIEMVRVDVVPASGPKNGQLFVADVEVGQALYEAVMGENPSFFWRCGDTCPVERVSWYEAVQFCNRLSEREGVEPAYRINGTQVTLMRNSSGYRLLSAAEWTAVAQAGSDTSYPGSDDSRRVAWTKLNSEKRTHPARDLRPTSTKIWDLGGNVAEWVWDGSGQQRQTKGGAWSMPATLAQPAMSAKESASFRGQHVGFRIARSLSVGN